MYMESQVSLFKMHECGLVLVHTDAVLYPTMPITRKIARLAEAKVDAEADDF